MTTAMTLKSTKNTFAFLVLGLLCGVAPAAWAGNEAEAHMSKAQEAFDRSDVVTAMSWYRKAAEMGYAPAQTRLAYLLDNSEENVEAVEWYRLAAEQHYPEAEFGLAQLYASGEGVERNSERAVALFTRAANKGHRQSIEVLAMAYEKGQLGLRVDYERAVAWLNVGVDAGDPWAIKRLAKAHRIGELGLRFDPERAKALERRLQKTDNDTNTSQ